MLKTIKYKYFLLVAVLISGSCSTWKKGLVKNGNEDQAIQNSITDFLYTSSISKNNSVFTVSVHDTIDLVVVSIFPNHNKLLPSSNTKIGYPTITIPTKYTERNRKLFYWYDSKEVLTYNIVRKLSNYRVIDSINVNQFNGFPANYIDDSQKAVNYFICKKDFLNYKKLTTSFAFGYFDMPKVKCN